MRDILYKNYIPGTLKLEKDYTQKGKFHQWGINFEEFENGAASYTVALVELEDGVIVEVEPSRIKFVDNDC